MEIKVSIPDGFILPKISEDDLARQMLEAYAIENYRQEVISFGRFAEILVLSVDEANGLLKKHKVPSLYDHEDMERDRRTIEMFLEKNE